MKKSSSLLLLAVCAKAWADSENLPEVVVTATRTEQPITKALASVTVITREDLEKNQRLSVQGALLGVAGLGISNSGGLGKPSDVFMRGTNSDHVLVLVDGIRMGSATLGTTAFQDLSVDQIERIEIVRGPRSSLYGAEAIGGVIQIFTRKGYGKDNKLKPYLSVGGGTYNTFKVSGGLSGGNDKGWFNFSGAELYTGGINACQGRPLEFGGGGCYTFDPDHDQYSNTSGSAKMGYRFDNGLELEGNFMQTAGANRYDGTFGDRSDTTQQAIGGKLTYSPLTWWKTTLRAGTSADYATDYMGQTFVSRFNTRRIITNWQNDFTVAEGHLVSLGFDYYDDELDSSENFPVTSRDDKAGYLQYQGSYEGHSLDLSVRQDSNQQFGGKTTGSAAYGYTFGDPLRVTASYGTAFKAPTFNALYYPFFGNPNLKPESSQSVEVGGNGTLADVKWSWNGYWTQIDDLIAFDPNTFSSANIGKAEVLGMETQLSTRLFGIDINANLSLLDPTNQENGPNNGKILPRRPQQMAMLDLDKQFDKFRIGLVINQEGRRYDDLANTVRMHGFTTVGLRASYQVHKDIILEGRAFNLFNQHYQTAHLYNQMGTNLFLSLTYRPSE